MKVIILDKPEDVAHYSAEMIRRTVVRKPNATLGLATGSSPIESYRELVRAYRRGSVSFQACRCFNLDEYIGIDGKNKHSYRHFMQENLFKFIDIPNQNTHIPNGMASDLDGEALSYEEGIRAAGGIDLQLLGIGNNCHIGFNEPGSSLSSRTRAKALTCDTMNANSRFFNKEENQPNMALTMGIGTILEARKILLIATGEKKSLAIKQCIEGPISAFFPGSALQQHADSTIVIDEAAASLLNGRDYYKLEQGALQKAF